MTIPFVKYQELLPLGKRSDLNEAVKLYQNKKFLLETVEKLCQPELQKQNISGKRVLLKPNLVMECRKPEDEYSLHTNINLLLAFCEFILKMKPASLTIAEAPLQKCIWEKVTKPLVDGIADLQKQYGLKIRLIDLRKVVWNGFKPIPNPENNSEYLIFDLASNSSLEEISGDKHNFRVTNYDPERLARSHYKGKHLYCISKAFFEHDVIFTLPKLKTHQKAGLTCALKILVGINGDKDFLPHHRKGGIKNGGDCYPGSSFFGKMAESLLDLGNHFSGKVFTPLCYALAGFFHSWMPNQPEWSIEGNWYGNDTCWRMIFDLNTIALYGKSDGTLADTPQREIWSLADAIVGGEGKGPLHCTPLPMSVLIFSNNSYWMDWTIGDFWNLSQKHIGLLANAEKRITNRDQALIFWNGKKITEEELRKHGFHPQLPPGWINYKKGAKQ